jgi:RND family efflux transporter MFP subunit
MWCWLLVSCICLGTYLPAQENVREWLSAIEIVTPQRVNFTAALTLQGEVLPLHTVPIWPKIAGHVKEVKVEAGAQVNQGDVLLILDLFDAEFDYEKAKAQVREIEAEIHHRQVEEQNMASDYKKAELQVERRLARYEVLKLNAQNAQYAANVAETAHKRLEEATKGKAEQVPNDKLEESKQNYYTAQAILLRQNALLRVAEIDVNLARLAIKETQNKQESLHAQINVLHSRRESAWVTLRAKQSVMESAVVRAPLSGYITRRNIIAGDFVDRTVLEAAPLEIMDLSKVRIRLQLPETEISYVQVGSSVKLGGEAWPGKIFTSKIQSLSCVVDPATKSMMAEVELINNENQFRPGMTMVAEVVLYEKNNALVLPAKIVLGEENRRFVLVMEGDRVVKREVQLGRESNKMVEVVQGLTGKEKIVAVGKN